MSKGRAKSLGVRLPGSLVPWERVEGEKKSRGTLRPHPSKLFRHAAHSYRAASAFATLCNHGREDQSAMDTNKHDRLIVVRKLVPRADRQLRLARFSQEVLNQKVRSATNIGTLLAAF